MPPTPPSEPPASPPQRQSPFPWFWLGTFIGTVLSAAGLGLAAWAWIFIHEELSPFVAKALTESLERPLELGEVEKVTLSSIQVGPSRLGPSATDTTWVEADRVMVEFDLLEAIFTGRLGVDLTVFDAEGQLEQDADKGWLNFDLPPSDDEDRQPAFEFALDAINARNSQLTLVPLPAGDAPIAPILLDRVRADVEFEPLTLEGNDTRRTRLEIRGEPEKGGEVTLKGEVEPVLAPLDAESDGAESDGAESDRAIQFATNLTVQADKAPVDDVLYFTLATISLSSDDVTEAAGQVSGTVDMGFRPAEMPTYSGTIGIDEGAITTTLLPLPAENIDGQARFQGNQWTVDSLIGDYGEITAIAAEGSIDFDRGYDLTAVADDVSLTAFTNTIDLELPVPAEGTFEATAQMSGPIQQPEFSGSVAATTPVEVDRVTFTSATGDFLLQGQQLYLSDIAATPSTGGSLRGTGQVQLNDGSPFSFQLAGRSLPARQLANLYDIDLTFALGLMAADAAVLGDRNGLRTTVNWAAPEAAYPGSGVLEIEGSGLAFRDTRLQVAGGTVSGSGTLAGGQWNSDIALSGVQLSAFSETLKGTVSGQFEASSATVDLSLETIAARGDLVFSEGLAAFSPQFASLDDPLTARVAWNGENIEVIRANSGTLTANGTLALTPELTGVERFNLQVAGRDYPLNELPFALPSAIVLEGRTSFNGTLAGSPAAPSFNGSLGLADLAVNRLPFEPALAGTIAYSPAGALSLDVAGNRDRIALGLGAAAPQQSPPFNFDIGWRSATATGRTEGDLLNITARNFPLSALNFPPAGTTEIGQLRGTLTDAQLAYNLAAETLEGNIAIEQLGLGYIGAGALSGDVRYANNLATLTSGELILEGNRYDLSGSLVLGGAEPVYSANLETQAGDIQNIFTALSIYQLEDFQRGLTQPAWLEERYTQSELDRILATTPAGRADAALLAQLQRLTEIQALQAETARAEDASPLPPLGELDGPFAGSIQLDGSGTDFQLDFDLAGADWKWGKDYSAKEVIAKGSLTPNVLTFEPVRFASVIPVPVPAPASSASPPPENAKPDVSIEVRPEIAAVDFAGQLVFGRNTELTSNLQATAQNLNVEALRNILQLPLDVDGLANASATLGGTLANPQLRGSAELAAAAINDIPIQTAEAQFLYQNARLSLSSSLTANTPEQPLTLLAQVPYAFDFMEIQPSSDDISVEVNVRDEGLTLLNIFNQQVAWESGSGQVNLQVDGTISSPEIEGFAVLEDGVLSAKILPDPLTEVNGRARFSGDRIIVETLQGQYSDGQLIAAGIFPLIGPVLSGAQLSALTARNRARIEAAASQAAAETASGTETPPADDINPRFPEPLAADRPLTVNLENIGLTLDDLYRGDVDGQVIVGGSALLGGPQIGGEVILSDGQVLLNSNGDSSAAAVDPSLPVSAPIPAPAEGIMTQFRDLRLTLSDGIRVVQGNLLNFAADGTLLIDGPSNNLAADGTINIRSGQVNLFTTLFRLRGSNNTATFTPEAGLQNPFLDVSLRASVPEVNTTGPIASTPFATAETADNSNIGFDNPGSLRTIRVRADVEGPANAIFENLELSSSPARSQDELIGLIGGGFVTALESTVGSLSGGGDSFEGLIGVVSGALLNNIQNFIGSTLSLSEFRLFPVTSASRTLSEEDSETGLDIGAEVGFDVTENATVSVGKILTDDTNPEIGLNYRLSDSFSVRSTTNFDDINQVFLEYEIRF